MFKQKLHCQKIRNNALRKHEPMDHTLLVCSYSSYNVVENQVNSPFVWRWIWTESAWQDTERRLHLMTCVTRFITLWSYNKKSKPVMAQLSIVHWVPQEICRPFDDHEHIHPQHSKCGLLVQQMACCIYDTILSSQNAASFP